MCSSTPPRRKAIPTPPSLRLRTTRSSCRCTSPRPSARRKRRALCLDGYGFRNLRLIVNGYRAAAASSGLLPSLREIVERSSVRLLGVVPFDPLLQTDQEAGRITFDDFASRRARCYEAAFMNIAARITGRRVPLLKNVAYPVKRKKYVRA